MFINKLANVFKQNPWIDSDCLELNYCSWFGKILLWPIYNIVANLANIVVRLTHLIIVANLMHIVANPLNFC